MKESFTLVLTTIVPIKRRFDCMEEFGSCFNFQLQRSIYLPCCFHCFLEGGWGLGVGGVGGFVCMCVYQGAAKKLHVFKLFFLGFP